MVDDRPPPPDLEQHQLDVEADELRQQVRAGAATPEELRALSERLRAHRERELEVWRRSVKPSLKRTGPDSPRTRRNLAIVLVLALGVCAVVAAVILATT
jgi:hypothetical protein